MMDDKVVRTERGWPGHYICAHQCMYRRNTLLEYGDVKIVVSSVGNFCIGTKSFNAKVDEMERVGFNRFYECMAFEAKQNGPYWDSDVTKEVCVKTHNVYPCNAVEKLPDDIDNLADQTHEANVEDIATRMVAGEFNG